MERGDLAGVSESVLYALARGLQLNDAETSHLLDLAAAATGPARRRRPNRAPAVSPRLAQLIDTMRDVPTVATNRVNDPISSNSLGRALFPDLFPHGRPPLNHSVYLFLDDRARTFYPDWEDTARGAVSTIRLAAGHDPGDKALMALVGRLSMQSEHFRVWWADHTVRALNARQRIGLDQARYGR